MALLQFVLASKVQICPRNPQSKANCGDLIYCTYRNTFASSYLVTQPLVFVWERLLQLKPIGTCYSLSQVMCSPKGSSPHLVDPSSKPSCIVSQEAVWAVICAYSQLFWELQMLGSQSQQGLVPHLWHLHRLSWWPIGQHCLIWN